MSERDEAERARADALQAKLEKYIEEFKSERAKAAQLIKQIEWAKEHIPSEMKAWAILEHALAEYESQSE